MITEVLKTLYDFLGEKILEEENLEKLKKEIKKRIDDKSEFEEAIEFVKNSNFKILSEKILNFLFEIYFEKIGFSYDSKNEKLIYGENELSLEFEDIENKANFLWEVFNLWENYNLDKNIFMDILSEDINKRLNALKAILQPQSKMEEWKNEELKILIMRLKPLTRKFLKFLSVKGKVKGDEIIENLKLDNRKAISAFASAIKRNSLEGKEDIIFSENGFLWINPKYRGEINEILQSYDFDD